VPPGGHWARSRRRTWVAINRTRPIHARIRRASCANPRIGRLDHAERSGDGNLARSTAEKTPGPLGSACRATCERPRQPASTGIAAWAFFTASSGYS